MEHDHLNNPRPPTGDPIRDEIRDASWRRQTEGSGWLWPALGLGLLLLIGLLLFGNLGDKQPNTQVGQSAENPARPGAATQPNNTTPKTTPKQP